MKTNMLLILIAILLFSVIIVIQTVEADVTVTSNTTTEDIYKEIDKGQVWMKDILIQRLDSRVTELEKINKEFNKRLEILESKVK